jgi:hypothetical protein
MKFKPTTFSATLQSLNHQAITSRNDKGKNIHMYYEQKNA